MVGTEVPNKVTKTLKSKNLKKPQILKTKSQTLLEIAMFLEHVCDTNFLAGSICHTLLLVMFLSAFNSLKFVFFLIERTFVLREFF